MSWLPRGGGVWLCRLALVGGLVALVGPELWADEAVGYQLGEQVATLAEPEVTESSGLAASVRQPGILWTHNDSGGGARLYATDRTGQALATFEVSGATNRDWEDLALGPDAEGEPAAALYVADTGVYGDEDASAIYRITEPQVLGDRRGRPLVTAPAERFPLVFPGPPQNVETLLVHPSSGEVLLLSKAGSGKSTLYRAATPLVPERPTALERLGTVSLDGLVVPSRTATGGAVAPDGGRIVVRTYVAAFEWDVAEGETLAEALLGGDPRRVVMPIMRQGETIAYAADGRSLYATSEGSPCPLFVLPARGD